MQRPAQAPTSGNAVAHGALQAIFAVFLGLMITAFVGVGVYTFYPDPSRSSQAQREELYDEQSRLNGCQRPVGCKAPGDLTAAEQARLTQIDDELRRIERSDSAAMRTWSQRTSMILIVIATALMAISLTLGGSVTVLSNGVLLGGLFTMLYGVGWGLASGDSLARFLVLGAALAVSMTMGYLRFVRGRREIPAPVPAAAPSGPAAAGPEAASELAARVSDLERRLAAAAAWLAPAGPPTPTVDDLSRAEPQGQPRGPEPAPAHDAG